MVDTLHSTGQTAYAKLSAMIPNQEQQFQIDLGKRSIKNTSTISDIKRAKMLISRSNSRSYKEPELVILSPESDLDDTVSFAEVAGGRKVPTREVK